jgi:hypothetical protein
MSTVSVNVKHAVRSGAGYVVFITRELRALGWDPKKTELVVSAIEDGKGRIVVERR